MNGSESLQNDQSTATEDALRRAVDTTPAFIHTARPDGYLDYFNRGWLDFWIDPINASSQVSIAMTSMLTLIAYRFAIDSQLPLLPYMTRLDVFILASTLLVFFSLIEVVATVILDNTQKKKRALRIDRYCRVIFPVIFAIASIATFAHPRG